MDEETPLTGSQGGTCSKIIGVLRPCLAEFVGLALFVFVGVLSVQDKTPIAVAVAHGLTIAVLIMCFGHISGGHLNPAVTLGVLLSGGIGLVKALLYVVSQILGAVVGALLTRLVLDGGSGISAFEAINGGVHALGSGATVMGAIVCEVIITSILVLTVLLTAVDDDGKSKRAPIAIGLAVLVGILAGFHTSGGSMNPARSFGPAVATFSKSGFAYHYVYWVGPALGACLAAALYKFMFASENSRVPNCSLKS